MGIKKNLSYNKKLDIIEGYQDQGNQGRTNEVANKALVFILSGIRKKWKQPIAYYLSGNYTTADRLATLIKEVLEECFKVGLNIIATVCDLSRVNVRALDILDSTTDKPWFEYNSHQIIRPTKCFRNLFMKHYVLCLANVHSNGKSINDEISCRSCVATANFNYQLNDS